MTYLCNPLLKKAEFFIKQIDFHAK